MVLVTQLRVSAAGGGGRVVHIREVPGVLPVLPLPAVQGGEQGGQAVQQQEGMCVCLVCMLGVYMLGVYACCAHVLV